MLINSIIDHFFNSSNIIHFVCKFKLNGNDFMVNYNKNLYIAKQDFPDVWNSFLSELLKKSIISKQ